MEPIYYNNKEFSQILQDINTKMQEAEQSPFQQTKDLVASMLRYFDLMHREPLARLMKMIERDHPELKAHMETDYTIKTLFSLYDLLEGAIEISPLNHPDIRGFVPAEDLSILPPIVRKEKNK